MDAANTPKAAYRRIEDHLVAIRQEMMNLDSRNRRRLQVRLQTLNDSNCWWVTNWSKPLLLRFMGEIRSYRTRTPKLEVKGE